MFGKSKFRLKPEDMKPLATGYGACFATNMIAIDGKSVNFMYRELPRNDSDSGWKFFSGLESAEYIDDLKNTQIYDVNTIANYDPDIVPFLDSQFESAFERDPRTGEFKQVFDFDFTRE